MQNSRFQSPYSMGNRGMGYLIAEHGWHDDELLSCLNGKSSKKEKEFLFIYFLSDVKPQDIEVFIRRLFAYFYVDSLMYGNLTENVSVVLIRLDRFDKY